MESRWRTCAHVVASTGLRPTVTLPDTTPCVPTVKRELSWHESYASRTSWLSIRGANGLVSGTDLRVVELFGLSVVHEECVLRAHLSRRRSSADKVPKTPESEVHPSKP